MKKLFLLGALLVSFSSFATQTTVYACKKKMWGTDAGYNWVEIIQDQSGNHYFQYGIGYSDQMSEVRFYSPLNKDSDQDFSQTGSDYQVKAHVQNNLLSFSILDRGTGVEGKNYHCE